MVIAFEDGNGDDDDFLFALDPNTPPKTAAHTIKNATIPPYNSHFRRDCGDG